jgi:hypothetical protein
MINLSRDGVGPSSDDSFDEDFIGNIEENEAIGGDSGGGEGFGLGGCAWESV